MAAGLDLLVEHVDAPIERVIAQRHVVTDQRASARRRIAMRRAHAHVVARIRVFLFLLIDDRQQRVRSRIVVGVGRLLLSIVSGYLELVTVTVQSGELGRASLGGIRLYATVSFAEVKILPFYILRIELFEEGATALRFITLRRVLFNDKVEVRLRVDYRGVVGVVGHLGRLQDH